MHQNKSEKKKSETLSNCLKIGTLSNCLKIETLANCLEQQFFSPLANLIHAISSKMKKISWQILWIMLLKMLKLIIDIKFINLLILTWSHLQKYIPLRLCWKPWVIYTVNWFSPKSTFGSRTQKTFKVCTFLAVQDSSIGDLVSH